MTKMKPKQDSNAGSAARWRRIVTDYVGMILVLAVLVILFSRWSEHFLTLRTFATICNQIPDLTVIAVGMTFVLIIAGIDLSVGSVMAFSGTVLSVAMVDWGWPLWLAGLLGMSAGLACGLINGLISVGWSIPSFIVSLGMLEIARGGAYLVTDSQTKYIGASIEYIGAPIAGWGLSPAFFVALTLVFIGQFVLSQTVFGRYMIAVGTNEQAVRFSGIDSRPTRIAVFALLGLLTGLGGIFHASRLSAADPNAGIGLELAAIAAVVIGGTSLMGGRGSVFRTFLGVLIIAVLQSGLAQIGASEPTKRVITGAVIVIAVVADIYRQHWTSWRPGALKRLLKRRQ